MPRISLEQAKHHCRIEHDADDELLLGYMEAAYEHASKFLDMPLVDYDDEPGQVITPAINQAILLLVGHWYANREAVMTAQYVVTPIGFEHILQPYRKMGV